MSTLCLCIKKEAKSDIKSHSVWIMEKECSMCKLSWGRIRKKEMPQDEANANTMAWLYPS